MLLLSQPVLTTASPSKVAAISMTMATNPTSIAPKERPHTSVSRIVHKERAAKVDVLRVEGGEDGTTADDAEAVEIATVVEAAEAVDNPGRFKKRRGAPRLFFFCKNTSSSA